jgi:hypothetical protein
MNKKKMALYAIPIVIGVYLIYKQLIKPAATDKKDINPLVIPNISVEEVVTTDFPLKKGSKNSTVNTLQALLNTELLRLGKPLLVVDGIFGTKTEMALKDVTSKITVQTPQELVAINQDLQKTNQIAQNLSWAWNLVDAFNSNMYSNLVVKKPIRLVEIKKNFQGVWKPTARVVDLPIKRYNLIDYALRSALSDGSLRIEIISGGLAGIYTTDASLNLANYLDIE